ncbi:hypothetical protein BC939DRAFT_44949 [Gamsiella multidivaricata]|uniref:uncharacterized protein n=1 Tax=Gamsiella multidivaricata TaxID=101098 RepID=UPI00221FC9E2|nr:uncharacterized protein BC939DRAFT_44949 [Gamsiella multidivaricata]KAI7816393.1 hypothetical protein BC939DRAFT_44949 [Gamsiella multidivaricata]
MRARLGWLPFVSLFLLVFDEGAEKTPVTPLIVGRLLGAQHMEREQSLPRFETSSPRIPPAKNEFLSLSFAPLLTSESITRTETANTWFLMSHLQLGRISSAAAMVGMNSAGANPLLLASAPASLASLGFRAASVSPLVVHNTIRPFLANVGRNALVGAVAFTGQHGFVSLPEGAQDVGKLVSTATEKMGLGDNQFAAGGFQLALIGGILAGIRVLGSHAIEYLKKRIVVTAEFDSRDESYSWILVCLFLV